MEYNAIIRDLKQKKYNPFYLLMGEEPFYIDKITDYISTHVLSDQEKEFNQTILYGKDVDVFTIIDAARRYPMMASHQVVVVKEAQNIRDLEKLAIYLKKPLNTTILVINYKYKTVDQRKKFAKDAAKVGVVFNSKKIYDNKVPDWISKYLKEEKATIDPKAALMLTEFLGTNLTKVANELEKLLLLVPQDQRHITPDMVQKNIGISKDFNNFEFQKALALKDVVKANRIARYFGQSPKDHPIMATIAVLYNFFSNLMVYHYLPDKGKETVTRMLKLSSSFFVRDYKDAAKRFNPRKTMDVISILREFDAKAKGVGNVSSSSAELLREMVFRIMH